MTPTRFVEAVAALKFPSVFNPYRDRCPYFDLPDGAARRRQNLLTQIETCLAQGVEAVWIGRDLGYRGGRRTGLALTDEPNLMRLTNRYPSAKEITRATRGPIVSERTAGVVWECIEDVNISVFTWNVFPLHPHEVGEPLTNRCHTKAERTAVHHILISLLEMLRPSQVVAIGNDAEAGLLDLGVECTKVRHPSYGGVSEFRSGIAILHGHRGIVTPSVPQQVLF